MQKFLRLFVMMALFLVPWVTMGQNAKVSEYDYSVNNATYSTIVGTSGATAWTAADQTAGYVDIAMPFAMYLGETQVPANSTLRVYGNGSATFESVTGLEDSRIAPLYYASGYGTTATSVYTKSSAQQLTVEWRKVTANNANSYSFQLKLYNNGDIEFCYGPMTINSSISVFTGMMSSTNDVFRARGEGGTLYWNTLERATDYTTRTLSATYSPAYNLTTGEGVLYTFTQPACVKPTAITATATAWNKVNVGWTVAQNGAKYEIAYSTDADFDADAAGVTRVMDNNQNDTAFLVTVPNASTTYYFAVRKYCNNTPSGWLYGASATTPSGCPTLSGIASTNVTATGATLYWTTSVAATSFDVRYNLGADFDPDNNEGTLVNTTDTSKVLTGLAGASTYYYYVRANCVSNLTTTWYGPYSFNTLCDAVTVDAQNPYVQTFSDYSMPSCWNEEVVTGSTHWTFSGNGQAAFSYTPGASARLITPVFNLNPTGAYQVEFYHAEPDYSGGVDSLWLCYRTSTTGEWVRLAEYGSHSSTLEHVVVLLPNPSATYQLAFVSSAEDYLGMYVANVVVRTQPTCPAPAALAIDNVEGSSVTLSWTENGSATAWQIAYGLFTTNDDYVIVDATTNPFTVSNLGLGLWRFYVRSVCGAGDTSEWYGYAEQNFGYCTPSVSNTDGSGLTHVVFGESMIVDNTLTDGKLYQNFSSMIGDGFRGSTLTVNLTYSTGSYPYGVRVWVDWNQDLDFEDDGEEVYYGDASMTHTVNIAIPGTVALGDYRMRIGGSDGSAPTATCGSFTWSAFQDYTIRVIAAPSCFRPSNLAASGVTNTEATLTWVEAGLSTQWEVKYGPAGFNIAEGEGISMMVNNTPSLALNYLTPSTNYDVYVRAICDPEGPTEWSNKVTFKTICPSNSVLEIGTAGTTNQYLPTNSCYKYSWTEQIYTAAEIGGAMVIDNISFEVTTSVAADRTVTIYLGETDKTAFASTTDWIPANNLTQVYTGTMVSTSLGWHKIDFDTPFSYSGTGNLVIAVDDNTGSYKCTAKFRATNSDGNKAIRVYSDGTNYDPNTTTYTGTLLSVRNDIKIDLPCVVPCAAPQTAITLSDEEYAATLTFTDVNGEANPTYGIIWGPQGFNPATAGTTVSPINANTYTISNLVARTSYDVYVYAICGGNNGDMVRYAFTTPFIPNCKTPNTLATSNITYNTATLTWNQPGDQPQFWTVRYADADFEPATAAASEYTELTILAADGATAQLTGLVAGTTYYIYVKATCATAPDLDESPWSQVSMTNPAYTFTTPECVTPTAVVANDVTNSTAMISWTENGTATAWTVKYGLMGFDPDNEGTAVAATADSLELTGLDPYAYYDVYVKSNCTATDESGWSSPVTFRTACPDGGSATIGEGTSTTTGVPVANYGSTYCQQIFTADELREAGVANNIAGLAFNWSAIDASFDKYFSIWLANTDKSSFASTSDFVPYSDLTPVYGPLFIEHGTGAGEQEYVFNTPFTWDGNSNIVVVTLMNAGASDNNASRRAYTHNTGVSNISMYQRKDGSQYTEEQLATITGSSRSTYRANITFIAPCNTDVTCFAPASISASITPANVVTLNWAPRTDLRPVVNNYQVKYGLEGFNPETQGTLIDNLNDVTTYTINGGLLFEENYDVYVRTVCGAGDYSNWTKASFVTYPSCWAPVNLTVTATTQTSATLTWSNDSIAPTAATRWEVAYGLEGFNPDNVTPLETTNNAAFEVTGLNHSTKYEFYVRSKCSADDHSPWSAVAIGTTQCGVWQYADMPLVENFDGYTGYSYSTTTASSHSLPNCWDSINAGTTGYKNMPTLCNTSTYAKTGNSLMFYNTTATTNGEQYAILPEFGFALDTLEISFAARTYSGTASYVVVGTMSNKDDASTFVGVDTVHLTASYTDYQVSFQNYSGNGSYVAFKAPKIGATNRFFIDNLTVKLREKVNTLPNNGGTIVACSEFVMPDTTNGTYAGGLNATYVVRPAEAGKVAHITGSYDLEYGYDFIYVYRGEGANKVIVDTLTGAGVLDYVDTTSNDWAANGVVTLVFKSDADNALAYSGFKFLVSCECPVYKVDMPVETEEANGIYTWTAGNGQTYERHATVDAVPDLIENVDYTFTNVGGCDSVYRHLALTVHPDYTLNYAATICDRDEYPFYGQTFTTAGSYTVTLQSQYGADSTGILALTVNSAPSAFIQYNNKTVTEVANMCDNFDMTLNARSNVEGATFLWEDNSTAAQRVVNPHVVDTFSVVAVNPATNCTSLPATVIVTTTPVPALTISGDSAICFGQSTTLTLTDANNVPATYRWSTNATTESITVNPTATTTYTVTATSTTGACVATAEFTVTVNALPVVEVAAAPTVICQNDLINLTATNVEGYSYMWNTGAATREATVAAAATGNYTVTVTDQNGCVNEFTTNNVTVNPVYELNDEQSACVGMLPYTWGTQTLLVAGNYDQVFQTINGCDSTVHLTFTVQDTALNNVNRELCEGAAFTFGTGIYEQAYTATASTVISYVDTTSGECPARYNLNLTVNTHNPATVENTVCDTYTWPLNNETYTVSGAYQTMLQTTKGCDSLVTLNLTVNYQNTGIDMQTACDSYEWIDGNIYTADNNTATYTLANEFGCDSVVTLDLTVNYRSYHEDFVRVCDAKTYTWADNEVYALDVALEDSIQHITGENNFGCLEIALLHLDLNYVSDTVRKTIEACDEYVIDTVACDNSVATAYLRDNGVYTLRVHNDSLNRDEMLILTLTVTPSTYHTTIATECLPYTWTILDANDQPFEIATITADDVNGAAVYHTSVDMAEAGYVASGCSNIEVLRLTPKYPTTETIEATICSNGSWSAPAPYTYTVNAADLQIGENTVVYNAGMNETNTDNCPLIKQVVLTVNPIEDTTVNMTYCENEFVNGILNYIENEDTLQLTIAATGLNENVYNNTLVADWATEAGCARTVTFNYTVNPTTTVDTTVQALTEFVWEENDVRYTGFGQHVDTVETTNEYGCTLYKVLHLEISDSIRHYDTITVCTSYEVAGETYYEDRTFSEVDKNNEVWYTTYHVMQRTFNDVNIVTNQPYTWINGETYTANVSNVYYSIPATDPSQCDDVYRLNLTMVEPIAICEGQLPYATAYGFTIDTAVSDVYANAANDTIIAYTVKLNVLTNLSETACDGYTWNDSILGDTTYTESGAYTKTYDAANGCDSIVTLNLTINASTASSENVTYCDSYTWHGTVYTQSGNYTFDTVNAKGCDSTATLVLTINKNNGVKDTVTACDSYEWNGQTFTTSGDHNVTFTDANGCDGDSVLHLTINNTVVANADSMVNAASTYYLGVLYQAPTDTTVNDTLANGAANGCDSITVMHLQVNMGTIVQVDTVSCGDFTWIDGNTYTWIPLAERTNPVFNYKNRATGVAVEDFPVYEVDNDGDGLIDITYVLHLVMAEASVEYKNVTVLLSNDTYTDPLDMTNHVFDFTAEKAAGQNATKLDTLHYASSYYCDSIVYYTFNLVYNYDTTAGVQYVCYENNDYSTLTTDVVTLINDTINKGTANEMVVTDSIYRRAAITGTETIAACDSTTWNNTLFTANVVDSLVTLTDVTTGCDSVVTLNITITPTIHNVVTPADICDSYTWSTGNGETYTADTVALWSRANATDAQCVDVDTLKLVVKSSTTGTDTQVACDTYTWIDGNTYTASNTTATKTLTNAAGCDSVVTLNLTINNSYVVDPGTAIDTLGASITLTDSNGTYLFLAPYDGDTTLVYQTEAGCDSIVTFHLTVNQFQIVAENPIECGIYTWNNAGHGTGHTYKWISDAEKSANAINIPGASPMLPLYKDTTTNLYVYSRPMDTVGDIVYMLNLNLNEAAFVDSTIARFPVSMGSMTLHGTTYDFSGVTADMDTVFSMMIANDNLCGTYMTYHVHLDYNYDTNAVTVCYTDTYTWEDSTTEAVTVGVNALDHTFNAGNWATEQVVHRTVTVRADNNTYSFDQEACDSYTWMNGTDTIGVYTTTGTYTDTTVDQYGCDSVTTLNLTVKNNNNHGETLTACDSTQWNGTWYNQSGDYTYEYTHTNGCASVDTLHLTINHNVPQVTIDTACDSYTWVIGNWSREYTAGGTYTHTRDDANNCSAMDTLQLTIRQSSSYDSVLFVTDGSYRYTAQDNSTTLIMAGHSESFAEHYTNAAGCDSTLNITINVGEGYFAAEDVTNCNSYTWRDGNTYVWISAEERTANNNALYKNQTTGAYVMSNPIYRAANDGDYDSIYMLRLNLTQNYTEDVVINFPISLGTLTYGDSTFNFATTNDEGREFVNTTVEKEVHFASSYYCDSIHYLTINLQNNYSEVTADNADICVTQTSYTWRNHTLSTATNDFDHAHTYYMYDTVGTAEAPVVEYIKVTQHPVVYATERRTACDSYTWNGIEFTNSTSGATFDTVDMWGCDSTVTLMLTIKHNSNLVTTTAECESYQWKANNAAQTVIATYTQSGEYAYEYISDEGCPSTDSLYLTINTNSNTAYTVDECDSYTWNNMTLTASCDTVYAYTNLAGCPSVDTLHLTIRNNSNQGYTQVACDSYEWHDSTYTASTTAYYQYEAANGCASVDTLYLTINVNAGFAETLTACDSIDWNGHKYYESGVYTVNYADANGCLADSVLTLTVNNATHNSETVVACDSYTWHGTVYTTSGVQTYNYDNTDNCASVDTLHLTIHHSDYDGENYATMTVSDWCGDYTWVINGDTVGFYTESVETSTSFVSPETGCDSVVFLNLTIKNAPVIDTDATVCENTLPYTWRGIEMSAAGVETVTFPLENGCDSTIRFTLTINPKYETPLTANVCLGSGYTGNGFDIAADELPEVGDYTFVDSLTSMYGCDSIVTLTVKVMNLFATTVEATACDSYTWALNGMTYTASGNYDHTIPAVNSCDSVVTLALTIKSSTTGVDEQVACNRYTWIDGNTYTASNNTATFTLENAAGCDSVVTLNLTVNYSNSYEFDDVACNSYTWNGATYSQSGTYTYAGTNVDGCDSVVTLHLTINNGTTATVEATACNSYEWTDGDGQTYTESGAYTYTTTAANSCDSVVTLNLTINTPVNSTVTESACGSYTWNGETYTTSGTYTYTTTAANGCDSIVTLNLTINTSTVGTDVQTACDSFEWIDGIVYTASNNTATYTLTNAAGCDSVVTLNLTINASNTGDTSAVACNYFVWHGQAYVQSGDYTYTTENALGCDSVVTLHLTINNQITTTVDSTVCNSINWNNVDYYTSGSYDAHLTSVDGCDSVVTLNLTVNQPVTSTVSAEACDSYVWNGETYTTSGNYTYTTTAASGCDSVVTLTLTINTPANTTEDVTACESYTWHGQVYTTNGAYTFNFTDVNGCAAVATLNLTINTPANTTETVTACNSYSWNNQTYTNSGVYTSTFVDANGCNATATLNLTINNPVNAYVTATACESYTWNGQTYYTSGSYTYTATAANGCDSVTTLTLTINQPTTATVYAEACGSYTWNGQTYTQPGAYNYTTTGSNGCDSTVTLLLNLVQPVQTIINQTACDSYIWNGTTYTTSGSYSVTETAANGCDSVVTLNLTINNSVSSNFAETACNSYTWNGQAYTTSGTYTQVFTAHNGCDSTVTLNLTINTPTTATVTETACSSFDWNGETYTQSGSYTYTTTGANGCDSVTTLLLTINLPVYTNLEVNAEGSYSWNGETYTESGVYTYTTTAANGCDSIVTLTLTITPVYTVTLVSSNEAWGSVSESGTVAEYGYFTAEATANEGYEFVAWVNGTDTVSTSSTYIFQVTEDITLTAVFAEVQGISTVDMNNVVIYSNDTRIFVNGAEGYDVYVYDVNGRVISRQLKAADAIEFRMSTTGVYLVKVGNAPAKRVIVVR